MTDEVREYLAGYQDDAAALFAAVREIVCDSVSAELEEKLWARLPSYYVGDAFVRLIPFADHLNIEAQAVVRHRDELTGYRITPKGMLQIGVRQAVPRAVLKRIFAETLG